jgi:hypothetical protein
MKLFEPQVLIILMLMCTPPFLVLAVVILVVAAPRHRRQVATEPTPPRSGIATAVPAGWYPDPSNKHQQRYWDGAGWSAAIIDGGQPGSDPL